MADNYKPIDFDSEEAIMELLLNKGANVNAEGGEYGNALQAASYNGHEAIIKLLLDKGADVNAHGGYFGNALQAASEGGHEAITKLLLDKGINHVSEKSSCSPFLPLASLYSFP